MTAAELVAALERLDPELPVWLEIADDYYTMEVTAVDEVKYATGARIELTGSRA